jgi:RsiW-degrading membrane proteinase PrsW (M82 family)
MATQETDAPSERRRVGGFREFFGPRHIAVAFTVLVSSLALSKSSSFELLLSRPGSVPVVVGVGVASLLPAFFVSVYVRVSDPDKAISAGVLTAGFCLGAMVAVIAGTLNGFALERFRVLPFLSLPLFFFLFVGPIEEGLKLLAVRLHPGAHLETATKYAVLGAFVGLGFAFSENLFYVVNNVVFGWEDVAGAAVGRAAVSPLHVMMTTVAGYYVGRSGLGAGSGLSPVVKGLVVVSVLHATYNTAVTVFEDAGWAGGHAVGGIFLVCFFVAVVYAIEEILRGSATQGTRNENSRREKTPSD